MRFVVFLLGVLASLLVGFFGWFWLDRVNAAALADFADHQGLDIGIVRPNYASDFAEIMQAAILLCVGGLLGLLGCLLVVLRRGKQGAVLMFVAAIGPAIINPMTLMFTVPLIFVGLLSLFVRPLPYAPAPALAEVD